MIRKLLDCRGPFSPWRRSPYETKFSHVASCSIMIASWILAGFAIVYAFWRLFNG